jgi:undecaprenyl-phosphate 4-deoxy-4-formamido-L-arabinose transferase
LKKYSISIVVPVYSGAETITPLVERLEAVLAPICNDFEVILVNDGSPDNSWQVISQLGQRYPWLRGINLMRNYGQHNATLCGVREAHGEITVTMVYGIPQKRPHSWWRNWFSVVIKRVLAQVMGIGTIRDIGAFRAFRTRLRNAFATYGNPNVILDVLLSWGTSRFATVIVQEKPREIGESNYTFMKLVKVTLVVLTGFSTLPLRLASMLGFGFTLFGVAVFLYVLIVTLLQGSLPGFPFLASIISLFSGMQLFALGIIGEYLARVFDRSMDRPAYVVDSRIEMENKS